MISAFVISYGYLAVFLGTLLESETILLSAGFAANRGLLHWPLVVAVAFVGATLGDQIAFLLGRWRGASLIARFPALARNRSLAHRIDGGPAPGFRLTTLKASARAPGDAQQTV